MRHLSSFCYYFLYLWEKDRNRRCESIPDKRLVKQVITGFEKRSAENWGCRKEPDVLFRPAQRSIEPLLRSPACCVIMKPHPPGIKFKVTGSLVLHAAIKFRVV